MYSLEGLANNIFNVASLLVHTFVLLQPGFQLQVLHDPEMTSTMTIGRAGKSIESIDQLESET